MRADRLLSILLLLQTHRRLTARELAKRLEVSERTIHRDLAAGSFVRDSSFIRLCCSPHVRYARIPIPARGFPTFMAGTLPARLDPF